jgi:hypothetical protein
MPGYRLSRRAVLRGAGAITIPLPGLEIMSSSRPASAAGPAPKRFFVGFGGYSVSNAAPPGKLVTPMEAGANYKATVGLQPIFDAGMQGEIGLVSGLKVPWTVKGVTAPGGRPLNFHGYSCGPQVTGNTHKFESSVKGPVVTKVVHQEIGAGKKELMLMVHPKGLTSNDRSSIGGTPITDPRVAWRSLFENVSFSGGATAGAKVPESERRKSIIDHVKRSAERLAPRLGRADQIRMDRHLTEIRDVEKRLTAIPAMAPSGACKSPADPGTTECGKPYTPEDGDYKAAFWRNPENAYCNEALRAEVMMSFTYLSFACDLTRVAQVVFHPRQCNGFNLMSVIGVDNSPHGLGHWHPYSGVGDLGRFPSANAAARLMAWYTKHFTTLIKKLKETYNPEDNSSVLDHFAGAVFYEGGGGFNPERAGDPGFATAAEALAAGKTNDYEYASHSTENMQMMIAGRAGGLKCGQHIRFNNDRHPAQVFVSLMKGLLGNERPLGEISGSLPEMFRLSA